MKRQAFLGLCAFGAALLLCADSAQAGSLRDATGDCKATAQIAGGPFIDAYSIGEVYEIPLSGSATYDGQVGSGEDRPERAFSGEIVVKTPPGIPDIGWTWDGTGRGAQQTGTRTWDLSPLIPRDVPFRVEGFHADDPERCDGFVEVTIAGGLFDSPLAPASLAGTAFAAAGVAFAGVRKVAV